MKWQCPKLKAQEKEQWLAEARASGLVKQEETSLPSSSTWTSTARSRSGVRASWAAGQRRHAAKLRRRRGRRPSSRSRSRVSTQNEALCLPTRLREENSRIIKLDEMATLSQAGLLRLHNECVVR